jgi:hypothetical protein
MYNTAEEVKMDHEKSTPRYSRGAFSRQSGQFEFDGPGDWPHPTPSTFSGNAKRPFSRRKTSKNGHDEQTDYSNVFFTPDEAYRASFVFNDNMFGGTKHDEMGDGDGVMGSQTCDFNHNGAPKPASNP